MASSNIIPETKHLINEFVATYERKTTKRAYRYDLESFFSTVQCSIEEIEPGQVNAWIESMQEAKDKRGDNAFANSTIKRGVGTLRIFFDWLIATERVGEGLRSPASKHVTKKLRRHSKRDDVIDALSQDQLEHLIASITGDTIAAVRDRAIVRTLTILCLRRSEAVAMSREHIQKIDDHWVLRLPSAKGGDDQFVKVPDGLAEELFALCSRCAVDKGPIFRSLSNNNFLNPLSEHGLYQIVKRRLRKAKLNHFLSPHSFRATGCTLALKNGASVKQVQDHARHASATTTLGYVRYLDKLDNSAADLIPA